MRKFIVSDLHGNGNIYDSIIGYLNNINEELTLYINGDLIDRGKDSARMLIDVYDRITNNKEFKIEYLGGNHELMMYKASLHRYEGYWPKYSDWIAGNGGNITLQGLNDITNEKMEELVEFVSNLKIYHKFSETINNKPIVLVHAKCPKKVEDICDLKINGKYTDVYQSVWFRKEDDLIPFLKHDLGNPDFFTIIGHTPLNTKYGFKYDSKDNVLNIDGGCAPYVLGYQEYDQVPLVEVEENRLSIITFNNNNEIIYGNYFDGNIVSMNEEELNHYRSFIDTKVKKKIKG